MMKVVTVKQVGGNANYMMDQFGSWTCVESGTRVTPGSPLYDALMTLVRMH